MGKRLDWRPVVRSFLFTFQKAGFKITGAYDGEESVNIDGTLSDQAARNEATDIVTSVDDSHVVMHYNRGGESRTVEFYIVLGNEPEELVADYWVREDDMDYIKEVMDRFTKRWEYRPCPYYKPGT